MKTVEVIVEYAEKNLSAYMEDAPIFTVGKDLKEIEKNIREAIDFYLEDKTKDINFELNQYDNNSNLLKPVYQQERVDETLRIFMYCHGYSIFELVFDKSGGIHTSCKKYSFLSLKNKSFALFL